MQTEVRSIYCYMLGKHDKYAGKELPGMYWKVSYGTLELNSTSKNQMVTYYSGI